MDIETHLCTVLALDSDSGTFVSFLRITCQNTATISLSRHPCTPYLCSLIPKIAPSKLACCALPSQKPLTITISMSHLYQCSEDSRATILPTRLSYPYPSYAAHASMPLPLLVSHARCHAMQSQCNRASCSLSISRSLFLRKCAKRAVPSPYFPLDHGSKHQQYPLGPQRLTQSLLSSAVSHESRCPRHLRKEVSAARVQQYSQNAGEQRYSPYADAGAKATCVWLCSKNGWPDDNPCK